MNTTARWLAAISVSGSAAFAVPSSASAGGFIVARFGGEDGHAASDSVTSLYYNPAGIAFGDGTRIYAEGTFAYRVVDYDRDAGAIDNVGTGTPEGDGVDANSGPAHLGNLLASPFIGVTSDLGRDDMAIGLGFYAPFGGQAAWDQDEAFRDNEEFPGALEGPARWATIEGAQRNLYVTLGGAWASPGKKVGVGVGVNVVISEISLVRARNATGTDDLVTPGGQITEGRSLLEVSDLTLGLGLGASWRPDDKLMVGASYQIKPGFGEMSLDGELTNRFGSSPETTIDVQLRQRLPDVLRVGLTYAATPKVHVRFAADWQRWSSFDNQCLLDTTAEVQACIFNPDGTLDTDGGGGGVVVNLDRNWKDTFGVAAGVMADVNEKIRAGGSLSFDSNAVPDETMDPSLFDMNKVIAQGTAGFAINDKVGLQGTLGHVVYFSRTTAPRDVDPAPPSQNPDMAGDYSQRVTYAMLGVAVKL